MFPATKGHQKTRQNNQVANQYLAIELKESLWLNGY